MTVDSMIYVIVFGGATALLAIFGLFVMVSQNRRGFDFDFDDPNLVWKELERDQQTQALERRVANAEQQVPTTTSSTTGKKTFGELFPTAPKTFPQVGEKKATSKGFFQLVIFGVVAIIGGSIAAGYAFVNWTEFQDSETWSTTDGVIIETNIYQEYDSEDEEYSYEPNITYRYVVDGAQYESDRIGFFSKSYDTQAEAQEVIDSYRQTSNVEVIYNPDNPEKAVLERRTDETLLAGLGIGGGIAVIIGLSMIVFGILRLLRAASSF